MARYSAVRRRSGHVKNSQRSGSFYKFLSPSRFGKGLVMDLISKLGTQIEKQRIRAHESFLTAEKAKPENNNIRKDSRNSIAIKNSTQRFSMTVLLSTSDSFKLDTHYSA